MATTAIALKPPAIKATATAALTAAVNDFQPINASSGPIAATLPALSTALANNSARVAVEKATTDTTNNPVTVTCAGSDTFASGAATIQLVLPGEKLELQAATVNSTVVWKVIRHHAPKSAYDNLLGKQMPSPPGVAVLVHKLTAGADPSVITAVGDSTFADAESGFNRFVSEKLAPAFPLANVLQRNWDSTNERYGQATTVQTSTAGARRYVSTGASTDRFFTVADSTATSPSTALDVRVKAMIPAGTFASAAVTLAGKYDTGTNNRGWFFQLAADGKLNLYFSTDGTSGTQLTRASTVVVPPAAQGVPVWFRVTWVGDNGASGNDTKFFYSTDGVTWTQIGSTVTAAGVQTIFDSAAATQLVARSGSANSTGGAVEYYGMQVYTSLATSAVPVIDIDLGMWNGYGSSGAASSQFPDFVGNTVQTNSTGNTGSMQGGPVLFVLNGAVSGSALAYASDATRFPKLTPVPSDLFFVNYSHNEIGLVQYRTPIKALVDAVKAKWPDVAPVLVAQNPRFAPTTNITEHAIRGNQIVALAQSQGYGLIDAYKVFMKTGNPSLYVSSTDGIHPTKASTAPAGAIYGYTLIRDAIWALVAAWL